MTTALLVIVGIALVVFGIAWLDYRRACRRLETARKEYYERMRSDA